MITVSVFDNARSSAPYRGSYKVLSKRLTAREAHEILKSIGMVSGHVVSDDATTINEERVCIGFRVYPSGRTRRYLYRMPDAADFPF